MSITSMINTNILIITLTILFTSQSAFSKVLTEPKLSGKIVYGACNKLFIYNLNTNKSKLIYTHKKNDGKDWLCHVIEPEWINNRLSIAFYVECLISPTVDDYREYRYFTINENGKGISEMNQLYERSGYSLMPLTRFNRQLNGYIITKNCNSILNNVECDLYLTSFNAKLKRWYLHGMGRQSTLGYSNNRKLRVDIQNDKILRFSKTGTTIYTIKSDNEKLSYWKYKWSDDDKYLAFIVDKLAIKNIYSNSKGKKRDTVITDIKGGRICVFNVSNHKLKCKDIPSNSFSEIDSILWSNSNNKIYFFLGSKAYIYNVQNNTYGILYNNRYHSIHSVAFINDNNLVATIFDHAKPFSVNVWSKSGCKSQLLSNYPIQLGIINIKTRQFHKLVSASSMSNNPYRGDNRDAYH